MKDTIVIVFEYERGGHTLDIEVPKNLTANELIFGLNEGLKLGIDVSNPNEYSGRFYPACPVMETGDSGLKETVIPVSGNH